MKKLRACGYVFFSAMLLFGVTAEAYIDPSVMTYVIQAVAGVVIAVGAVVGIYWRKAKKKAQENLESWQHERADFSNYKKRIERDQEVSKNKYKEDVLKKFLPVLDDLELAYAHRPEEGDAAAWAEGIELIIRKFKSLLENDGLTKIDVKAGDKLDPNIHMAVSLEENDEFGSDEVIEVLQDGYRMGEKIVRPAMVRVAR